jgi:hypothetical protein
MGGSSGLSSFQETRPLDSVLQRSTIFIEPAQKSERSSYRSDIGFGYISAKMPLLTELVAIQVRELKDLAPTGASPLSLPIRPVRPIRSIRRPPHCPAASLLPIRFEFFPLISRHVGLEDLISSPLRRDLVRILVIADCQSG